MPMKRNAIYLILVLALAASLIIFKQRTVSNTRYQECRAALQCRASYRPLQTCFHNPDGFPGLRGLLKTLKDTSFAKQLCKNTQYISRLGTRSMSWVTGRDDLAMSIILL
jgi:hypothetical protein